MPTATFRVLSCFFVIEHERHRPIGSCSNCAKPFRRRLLIATPFWITIRSSTST
jgi:hypothetical protein